MTGNRLVGMWGAGLLLGLIALVLPAVDATGQPPVTGTSVIEVRFAGDSIVRGSDENLRAATRDQLGEVEAVLADAEATEVEPLVGPGNQADATAIAAEARELSGSVSTDMSNWYRVTVPSDSVGRALELLRDSPRVVFAARAPRPLPPPSTPDYSPLQFHLRPAPTGIGSEFALAEPLARGAGVTIVDLEYHWTLNHEDLKLPANADLGRPAPNTLTPSFPQFPGYEDEHGTAVLGEMVAKDNGFGVTGGVPDADMRVISPFLWTDPAEHQFAGYNPAAALNFLATQLEPGDVVLVEQQAEGPSGSLAFVPLEWEQPVFDAIRQLTNLGIVVVETGANGYQDLDSPAMLGRFDRSVRDSGAIIVGAGDPVTRAPMDFSSTGTRIDLQGPGLGIVTTGFTGDLQGSAEGHERTRYTSQFNGTSGAAPIVVNAIVAVQSYLKATGRGPWTADRIVDLLGRTATAQGDPGAGNVGGLPNLERALGEIAVDPPVEEPECLVPGIALASAEALGETTRLLGATDPSRYGAKVTVRRDGVGAGTATVKRDGTIAVRVSGPKSRKVRTKARYQLSIGGLRSNALRSSASVKVLSVRSALGGARFVRARLTGVRKAGRAKLTSRPLCGRGGGSRQVEHDRTGVFTIRLDPGGTARTYTLTKGGKKLRLPVVLPAARFSLGPR